MEKKFCYKCGLENNNINNYCTQDGNCMNQHVNSRITIKNKLEDNCSRCNNLNDLNNNYCTVCGEKLHYMYTKDKSIQKIQTNLLKEEKSLNKGTKYFSKNKSISLNKLNYISIFVNPIIVIALTSVCSILFKQILLLFIESEFSYGYEYILVENLIENINTILILNLSPIKLYGNTGYMGNISTTINFGVLVICIVPLLIIVLTNLLNRNNKNYDTSNILVNTILSSAVYSCILVLMATISSKSITIEGVTLGLQYSIKEVFLKSFILYMVPTLYIDIKRCYKNEASYFNIFNKVVSVISIQVLVCIFIMIMAIMSQTNEYDGFIELMILILIIIPFTIPIICLVGGIPVSINGYDISLFKFKEFVEYMEYEYILSEFVPVILITILMASILLISLFFVGMSLKSKYREITLKPVLIFSGVYSLIMGAIIYIGKFEVMGDMSILGVYNDGNFYIGSSLIFGMITSFIYSFIISFIGYKIKRI